MSRSLHGSGGRMLPGTARRRAPVRGRSFAPAALSLAVFVLISASCGDIQRQTGGITAPRANAGPEHYAVDGGSACPFKSWSTPWVGQTTNTSAIAIYNVSCLNLNVIERGPSGESLDIVGGISPGSLYYTTGWFRNGVTCVRPQGASIFSERCYSRPSDSGVFPLPL